MASMNQRTPSEATIAKALTLPIMRNRKLISHTILFVTGLILGINIISFHRDYFLHVPETDHISVAPPKPAPLPERGMDDEELLRRAGKAPPAKVAFMFLARGEVAMAPLWERFFGGHDGFYSVYVHSDPSFHANVSWNSPFYGRWIRSKAVKWGQPNMGEAERRLLGNALLDPANQRFVLLSEACIPLFNFSTVYDYLTGNAMSFVEAFDDPGKTGRGRYNPLMQPTITLSQWRKGSQWFTLSRRAALAVVNDRSYFPLFRQHCWGYCYTDEHYLPTFLSAKLPGEIANRTLTWADWRKGGPHPTRYVRGDVTVEFLWRLRHGIECEGRPTEKCHLFARKFLPNTLDRLLRFAPKIMHFG